MRIFHGIGVVLLALAVLIGVPTTSNAAHLPAAQPETQPAEDLFITSLREKEYGSGTFNVDTTLQVTNAFTRTLIRFESDGYTVYGFMNTPKGAGPFPIVLVLHGYVNPRSYRTPYGYTQRYADYLARQGFLVIHPDYRGHGRSEGVTEGPGNLFRIGYATDVLNLIEFVKRMPNANPGAIGLLGHSMGGGIALRVMTVSKDVKAAVLYGSMNADEKLNTYQIKNVFRGVSYLPEDDVPIELWDKISPVTYLGDITAAVEIHHGERDPQVPVGWGRDLRDTLTTLGKPVSYFEYPRAGHSLQGRDYTTMMARVTAFYRENLR
jgi:dipeptidyl aminopeptidase/acylaminoacyl peptidase